MNCTLTITVEGKPIQIHYEGDGSYPSPSKIIEILKESTQWESVKKELMPLVDTISPKRVKLKFENKDGKLKDASGQDLENLIPNVNLEYLKREFPKASFPETIDGEVLLIDNVTLSKGIKFGRNLLPNGKVLYITNKHNVKDLANFFTLIEKIKDFKITPGSDIETKVKEIGNKRFTDKQERTVEDIIYDYSINKSKYSKIPGAPLFMQNLLREINGLETIKPSSNDLINNIKSQLTWHKVGNTWTQQIKTSSLYTILKNNDDKLEKVFKALGITGRGANFLFASKIGGYDNKKTPMTEEEKNLQEVKDLGIENYTYFSELLNKYLASLSDDGFPALKEIKGDYAVFKTSFNSMRELYSEDTIEAIAKITPTPYLGYNVYAQRNEEEDTVTYFVTKYRMDSNAERVVIKGTKGDKGEIIPDAVKNEIKLRVQNEDIATNSMIEFKNRIGSELDLLEVDSFRYIPQKSIIRVIDSPVSNYDRVNSQFNNAEEYNLIYKYGNKIKDFQDYINSWSFPIDPNKTDLSELPISSEIITSILESINTPEKISLFLHKLNELTETPERTANETQAVNLALEEARKVEYKYYYIESAKSNKTYGEDQQFKYKYTYKLIPVKEESLQEYKPQPKEPSIKFMQAIHESFSQKFNVPINILNSDGIWLNFGNDFMTSKAFIHNDAIYINSDLANSEDLFHEYTHLLLGVLKSQEKTRSSYEQLLNVVAQTEKGQAKFKTLNMIYGDTLSVMSIREEVFASLFSEYLTGVSSNEITDIFRMNGSVLKEGTEIIFDTKIKNEEQMIKFYGSSLNTVFKKFSRDVAALLSEDSSFLSVNRARKQANYIDKKIKSGEIKEDCK